MRLDIGRDVREAGRARAVALDTLGPWGEPSPVADVAELVVSELVTNALRYGAGQVVMQLSRHDDGVVVEVYDEGVGTPRRRRAAADEEGGRGLLLAASVAAAWGVRTRGGGKVVWCRLTRHPA